MSSHSTLRLDDAFGQQLTARGTPTAWICQVNDQGEETLAILVNDIGLVSPKDGSVLFPLSGASGETWMTHSRIQPQVLTWLLEGGKLFQRFRDDKEACRKQQDLADEASKPMFRVFGYAGYTSLKQRHAKNDDYASKLQDVFSTAADGEKSSATDRSFATVHLQARQDLIHTLVAPNRLRIWLHAFRVLNFRIWSAIGDALQNEVLHSKVDLPSEHNLWKLRDRLVTMFTKDQDSLFSALEVHVLTADQVEERRKSDKDWHTDAFTSLLHMAITLQGCRTLGLLVQDGKEIRTAEVIPSEMPLHQMRQHPGYIYLGTPAVYRHAVYDHEEGVDNLCLQCRLGFPKWDPAKWSPWGEHGFHPWNADENKEAVRVLGTAIARAFRTASETFGGVRIPEWHQLASLAAKVSREERKWFDQHARPVAWERKNAPPEDPKEY